MSERVKHEAPPTANSEHRAVLRLSREAESRPIGAGLRLDSSHTEPRAATHTHSFAPDAGDRPARRGRDVFLQASQIAEELEHQFAELDRREQALNERSALLDQELRRGRLAAQQAEEEAHERDQRLAARETELEQRIATCERLISELQQQDQLLSTERAALETERAELRETMERELSGEWEALREAREHLTTEQQRLADDVQRHQRERDGLLESLRAQTDAEAARRKHVIDQEISARQADLAQQQRDWETRREADRDALRRERAEMAEAQQLVQAELRREREAHDAEVERRRQELSAEFEQWQLAERAGLAAERAEWEQSRSAERAEIDRLRHGIVQQSERAGEELLIQRQQQQVEIDQHREVVEQELAAARDAFQADCEQKTHELQRERAVHANRLRFQEEHLEKSRTEQDAAQRVFRIEHQQSCQRLSQASADLQRRSAQLVRFRSVLDEREASLERERKTLTQIRKQFDAEVSHDRTRLLQERAAWEQQQTTLQVEARRQQDLLASHAKTLDARRERLDKLRAEVEETHRISLETRLTLEEAWAQFSQLAGLEVAHERMAEARDALSSHYRHLREALNRDRAELDAARRENLGQHKAFHHERATLTAWVEERDQQLRDRESRIEQETQRLASREEQWRNLRSEWTREKVEAERIIRALLQQVAETVGHAA